jgi:uncharacterized membrane protein YtjA (UPF0391 family)
MEPMQGAQIILRGRKVLLAPLGPPSVPPILGASSNPAWSKWSGAMSLLKWALIMFIVSLVAAIFGFTGLAAASADVARVLFYIFVVIFVILLVLGLLGARAARGP